MKKKIFEIDAKIKSAASADYLKPGLVNDLTSASNAQQENFLCETVEDAIKNYLVNFFNNIKVTKHGITPSSCKVIGSGKEKGITQVEIKLDNNLRPEGIGEPVWLEIEAWENKSLSF